MNNIKLLGVPFSYGQPRRGVELAAEALRDRGFLSELQSIAPTKDLGDIDFSLIGTEKTAKNISLANELIHQCVSAENLSSSFLLNVGGDHGLALGSIHGLLSQKRSRVVVWADAHGDINTPESSTTGNFHGMPLSFLLGLAKDQKHFSWIKSHLAPHKLIFFGPRDLDSAEEKIIKDLSIQYYSSETINRCGTELILEHALKKADPYQDSPIHLSFDVDVFDGEDVQATGTRVMNGPHIKEVMKLGKILGETGRLQSMDLVEINPELADEWEVKKTLELATYFTQLTIEAAFLSSQRIVRRQVAKSYLSSISA